MTAQIPPAVIPWNCRHAALCKEAQTCAGKTCEPIPAAPPATEASGLERRAERIVDAVFNKYFNDDDRYSDRPNKIGPFSVAWDDLKVLIKAEFAAIRREAIEAAKPKVTEGHEARARVFFTWPESIDHLAAEFAAVESAARSEGYDEAVRMLRSGPAIDAMMDGDKMWSINSVPRLERALHRVADYLAARKPTPTPREG
jgi:hypothetical protein